MFVKADTVQKIYVDSDSATNGDGSQTKPFQDLYFAMNSISTVVTQITQNNESYSVENLGDGTNTIIIYLNANAQKQYNIFNPTNSPKTYKITQTQNITIIPYSSNDKDDDDNNKPTIRLQDFMIVQNSSFSLQGCKFIFAITDANKEMQNQTNQVCQMDLIGSLPLFYQVTFQILDETSGGFIPTYELIIRKEQQEQKIRENAFKENLNKYDKDRDNKRKNNYLTNSPKDVYLKRSFLCTHQQYIKNTVNNNLLSKNNVYQSSAINQASNDRNIKSKKSNDLLEGKNYFDPSQLNTKEGPEKTRTTNDRNLLNQKKQAKLKSDPAQQCAFSQIEIVDSYIKVGNEDLLSIWEGSIIELNFANNDDSNIDTCELSNIYVRNLALCSDMVGTIFTLNYDGSQDADFEKNVVSNLHINNSHLYMVDIFELKLLQSELKECQFNNFTLTNSLLQSSVGADQSGYIRISIQQTKASIKRELQIKDHVLKNNTFINARYFSVEPQFQTEEVKTIIENVQIDGNQVINTNSKEIQMFSNATQISIYNSFIQNNIFEQIIVFDSQFNQVVDTIEFNNNYVYNNTLTNAIFYSAELMDMSSIKILSNQFLHNFQVFNSEISLTEQNLIQSSMFNLIGKASELDFNDNLVRVGKPINPVDSDCTCYIEQFSFFMTVDSIRLINMQKLVFEDICEQRQYKLRQLAPNAISNKEKHFYQHYENSKTNLNQEMRGGFLQLKGFVRFNFQDSIFRNILTSSPLMSVEDEYYISSQPKNTLFKNITLENNTLLLISESSLLNFNYQDNHNVNFINNKFIKNILILAMDRVIGYTAPCISFRGYNSVFNMTQNYFKETAIRFEVYSLSLGGNALIAAVNITITDSKFEDSCQNMIDSSVVFLPSERQCFKNLTDIDESFLKFSDGGALNLFGTNTIMLKDNYFLNNEAKRGGALFLSGQVENVTIQSCNFTDNSAIEGGAIYSEQVKVMNKVFLSHLNFLKNSALKYGVVIDSFLFFKTFEMENCIFANNYIRSQGSDSTYMVKLEKLGNCTVKFSNIYFFGNNEKKFSGDYFQIFHSNQNDSRSNKNVITNQDELKHIHFQHCYFYVAGQQTIGNIKYFPQAITIMSRKNDYNPVKTPVNLENIVFSGENRIINFLKFFPQQVGNEYLLKFFTNQTEEIKEIKYSSQAFYANNVDVIMNNTNIMNILHTNGCVTIRNSYLQITNSSFQMNYKATRYYNASQLVITSQQPEKHKSLLENVKFKGYVPNAGDLQYDSQMVSLNNIQNVEIKNCQFIDASADYGSAIQIQEMAQNISITGCTFENNWSRYSGGSIYVEKDCINLKIQSSTFSNSKSYYGIGGAILIQKMNNNFNISYNQFSNNLAVFGNSISILSFDHDSLKSVLAFNSYQQDLKQYLDVIDQFAKFVEKNQAMQGQNNIVYYDWQQIIPSSEISLNFTMNYRSFSYEWNIQQTTISNYSQNSIQSMKVNDLINYASRNLYMNQLNQNTDKKELERDREEELDFETQVQYNLNSIGQDAIFSPIKPNVQAEFTSTFDSTTGILKVINNKLIISDDRGYLQTVAIGINNNITYYNYVQLLEKLSQYNLVDSNKNATYNLLFSDSLSLSSVVPDYPFFNKTTYQPYALGLGLSECDSGYSFDRSNRACNYCQQGVYSLDPKGYSPCQPCQQNAICYGGYKMEVNEGYWRNSLYSSDIIYCNKNPYNCLVPATYNQPYTCEEGYTGPLCQACDNSSNYFTNGDGRCLVCNNNWGTILIFVSKKIIFFLYECFYIYTTAFANTLFATRGHECHALNVRRLNKVYVRIIQTYFQIMSLIISQYSVVGEQFFQLFNSFFQLIGFPVDSVNYNYECWLYQKLGPDNQYYAYYASLISLSEPLFKILVVFIVWLVKRAFRIEAMKNRYFIISITSIILIEQLGVIKILLGSFKCISIEGEGSYMERNPNVSCQTSIYTTFASFIFIPMMALWAGGFTLLLFFYICRNKKNLEQKQMKLFFGFYYMCFRQKYFYWDIIIYLMKLLLLMLNYFVLNSDKLRFSCTTLILLGYCLAVKIYKPYTLDRQNKCDQILFYNLIFTMFLCYNIDNTNTSSLNILFIILLSLSNLSFIGYISWRMFYIVRYFFKKFKGGAAPQNVNQKKSFKQSIQDKDEESEDEEQKNYLMQAEMEYNHLEIAIKDNNEEVIIKEDDQDLQLINQRQAGIIPQRKQETEAIRQRYELHQYLKSIVEHNQQQPVYIDHYSDNEGDDSLINNQTPQSSNTHIGKASFAFQQKRNRIQQGGSIVIQNNRGNNFKSFNQPLGRHDFGGNKKKSMLQSQIQMDRTKTGSNNNMQSMLINPNSNNNLLNNHKESVGGSSAGANQNNNINQNYRNQEFQSSLVSASSNHNLATLKKSFIQHIERDFNKKKKTKASMAHYHNQYNYSQLYDQGDEDEEEEDYESSHLHFIHNPNNRNKKWTQSNIYAEDEVRQRNAVLNKSQLFQDQNMFQDVNDTQINNIDENELSIQNQNNSIYESNIMGSNIKINQLNNHLFSDRRATGSKFNPQTTRAPSTHTNLQGNQLYSTQNELDGQFVDAKESNSLNQQTSNIGGIHQNNNKYDSDSFYIKDKSQNYDEEDEEEEDDNKNIEDQYLSEEKDNSRNNSQDQDKKQ